MASRKISELSTVSSPDDTAAVWVSDPTLTPKARQWTVANVIAWVRDKFSTTPVTVAEGGTGSATASAARTALGLDGNSNTTHYHDGRYYTETEADAKYLQASNNLSDIGTAATARTNLGLGTAAVEAATAFVPAVQAVPYGSLTPFAGTSAPTGWMACDGSAISRTTYSDLFTAIGTTWGAGDGSTTFNIPDLRGAFVRGTGSHGSETMADGNAFAGPSVGSFEDDQMQGHWHDVQTESAGGGDRIQVQSSAGSDTPIGSKLGGATTIVTDGTNGTPRTGDETRPFAAGITWIIFSGTA